jgi:PAS domain S-box-containing protein
VTTENPPRTARSDFLNFSRQFAGVGRALADTSDQSALYRALRCFIAEYVPFDTFLVTLLDADTNSRNCAYCWSDDVELDVSRFKRGPLAYPRAGGALPRGSPVLYSDSVSEADAVTVPLDQTRVKDDPQSARSYLIVPMTAGGRVVGSVQLQGYGPDLYTPADTVPLTAVADHAAASLENARLLEEAAAARRRAERAAAREATLNRVGALLYSSLDPSEVVSTATRALRAVLGAHCATFLAPTQDGNALRVVHEDRRASSAIFQERIVPVHDLPQFFGRLRAGETVAAPDIAGSGDLSPGTDIFYLSGDRAVIHAPIIEGGALVGILYVGDSQRRTWEAEEVALARGVAEQVGVALRQAELFHIVARSREEWEQTFDAMADAVALVDGNDCLRRANRAFWKLFDTDERALGRPLATFLHGPDMTGGDACAVCATRRSGGEGIFTLSRCNSTFGRGFETTLSRVEKPGAGLVGMVQVIRDLTELRAAEASAARRQAILDSVLSSTADSTALLDLDGDIVWVNAAAERLAGVPAEQLREAGSFAFLVPAERPEFAELFERVREGEAVRFESHVALPNGKSILMDCAWSPVIENGVVTGVVTTARDITEQRAAIDRASEGEKLRALGQLASGVAHDFNNLLAAILGNTQLLGRVIGDRDPAIERKLAAIERAARDGAETVRRIQNFTRVQAEVQKEHLRVRELFEQAVELSRPRWKDQAQARGIPIHMVVGSVDGALAVVGSGAELREVLTNLIINAVDAMPMGGRITLDAERQGSRALLRVHDTGHGIDEATRRRIFEPFFTTRGPQNSGLGLAVSYGIVRRHGGDIEVESQIEAGTVFTLRLPIASSAISPGVGISSEGVSGVKPLDQRILVVDDDDAVREVVADALVEAGAEVIAVSSGQAALAAFEGQRFDLVVTDLGMPGVNGWDLAQAIARIQPDIRIFLLTGWGEDVLPDVSDAGALGAVERILAKPIDINDLVSAVRGEEGGRRKEGGRERKS